MNDLYQQDITNGLLNINKKNIKQTWLTKQTEPNRRDYKNNNNTWRGTKDKTVWTKPKKTNRSSQTRRSKETKTGMTQKTRPTVQSQTKTGMSNRSLYVIFLIAIINDQEYLNLGLNTNLNNI